VTFSFLLRWLSRIVVSLAIIVATIVLVRAFDSRKLPDLSVSHTVILDAEYRVSRDGAIGTLDEYLMQEQRVFDELNATVYSDAQDETLLSLSRFNEDSPFNSRKHAMDWNRTVELTPERPVGGALLLHGLTDSPYSMRSVAELLHARGFYVLALRLPGHGTAPGGLRLARAEDWQAVVEPAARHVRSVIEADRPFLVVGYSNGGVLAVNYALDALIDDGLPLPDQLLLLSPAIGVTPFAMFASWHKSLSWLVFFEKFAWQSVLPEYDPYKYNSFPKSAGHETYNLTQHVQEKLGRLGTAEFSKRFPAMLTFVSLVDSTVLTADTVDLLYQRLNRTRDELVIYDVNRFSRAELFLRSEHRGLLRRVWDDEGRRFELTLITNRTPDSRQALARTSLEGQVNERPIKGEWPLQVYSLSHVAIPFAADDVWYGDGSVNQSEQISFGALSPRGEKQVLAVPADLLLRLRYNPFFEYQVSRINAILADFSR